MCVALEVVDGALAGSHRHGTIKPRGGNGVGGRLCSTREKEKAFKTCRRQGDLEGEECGSGTAEEEGE